MFFGRADQEKCLLNAPAVLEPVGPTVETELPPPRPRAPPASTDSRRPSKPRKNKRAGTGAWTSARARTGGGDVDRSNKTGVSAAVPLSWRGLSESESDLSDSEGGGGGYVSQIESYQTRVRQHALLTLHAIIKSTPRRTTFSYWTSFIPASRDSYSSTLSDVISSDRQAKVGFVRIGYGKVGFNNAPSSLCQV